MANFTYTASKSFTPFTFEQMLKPLAMYTEEYNTIQEGIGELNNKAAIWDNLANQQTDERTYKRYKDFSEKLSNQADMLARQGLTPSSRKALLDLKRGYVSEIVPIEQAYNARAEEAKSQYEGRSKGLVYEGEAATSSLDRYLDNPSIRYNYANSQEGFKRVATAASALSKGLMNYGNGKRLDSYTKTWLQEHGYKDTDIASAISDIRKILNGDTDVQSNGVLRAILNDEMNTSGVNSWTNKAAVNDYFNRVAPALYQAVGQTTVSPYEDYEARLNEQARLKNSNLQQQVLNGLSINPLNIYSSKEQTAASNAIRSFSKYFTTDSDGNVKLTKEGLEEYNRKKDNWKSANGAGAYKVKDAPSEFKVFLDSIGGESGWTKYINDHRTDIYDATKVTEFDYPISGTQQGDMKDAIMTASRGLSLKEVDYDSKTKTFKDTDEELTMEDLKNDKYKVTATRFSPYGSTVMIQDDEGNVRRFRMPSGINTTNEQNRDAIMSWIEVLQDNRRGGIIRIPDEYARINNIPVGTTINVTPEQIMNEYTRALQEAYLYHSQLGIRNKTKEQEFNPYSY